MITPHNFEFTYFVNKSAPLSTIQTQVCNLPDTQSIAIAFIKDTDISVEAFKNRYVHGMGFHVVVDGHKYAAYGIENVFRDGDAKMTVDRLVETIIREYVAGWKIPGRPSAFGPATIAA
jgi:hypothetical protein